MAIPKEKSKDFNTVGLDKIKDETTPPSMSNALYEKIDQANYHEIKDSGHCPQIQQPEKLLSLILEIL